MTKKPRAPHASQLLLDLDAPLRPMVAVPALVEVVVYPDLSSYDYIIVAFSGGKDSWACILWLLDQGVPPERIELWHHEVDGREGSTLMDWPCTSAYVSACAAAFGFRLYHTWKEGGFEREMLRENARTAPIWFESPEGLKHTGGIGGDEDTRLAFPQVANDLSVRWCSAYLKIDNARTALRNQMRFRGARTLFLSGERAEESPGRAKYLMFHPDDADLRDGVKYQRHIDRWRPVHRLTVAEVWAMMERYGINPHPAYRLGWSRLSCMKCIFLGDDLWASLNVIDPGGIQVLSGYEERFDRTIHRTLSVMERVRRGTPRQMDPADVRAALSTTWEEPILLPPGAWRLPAGATLSESCGPT